MKIFSFFEQKLHTKDSVFPFTSFCIYVLFPDVGPELSTENMLQSISAALHVNNGPVLGQSASKQTIMKNPGINMDTHQPHIQQVQSSYLL